ncbi:aldo/keto reductase [Chitinophaga pinensis]|uniref:Aldo/keto reductase n=1 Tax=Chitinophaga pinensis (strain ATCC 43595 / DSM 2588 / LMG 13176 / NBRC 15968 / NCIMB 11800 / UQM 2034) TaxID=485918 RepID=A0A979G732_CHIPD|nr:aldo/keto reductase [Chitinophaga pinensis]ACU61976.1 aldo/keto reductase [Chitinophaga pinensis DSM 2588]
MNYKIFGKKSGLRVSELVLGTGNFGTRWGHGATPEESKKVFDAYVAAGGNFIDTADGYQVGESEELLSGFIADKRNDLVLASKFSTGGSTLLTTGNSRKNIVRSVEASLKRLNTDRLDLYWAHIDDRQTPVEEIVRGLDDLVQSGKIVYAGFSNYPAWKTANASLMADLRGWAPIVGIQIEYNLIERTPDRELLPMAEALGLGVAFWSPLAGGTLTGKYRTPATNKDSRLEKWGDFLVKGEKTNRETLILDTLTDIAGTHQAKLLHVALAWLRQIYKPNELSTVTIIGPRNQEQLQDNLDSLQVTLSEDEIKRLSDVSAISLGSPHEIITASQQLIFGAGSGHTQS